MTAAGATIGIVDYGAGNRRSVEKAVERVGVRLMVDGAAVLSTAGGDIENLHRAWWDVRAWRGRTAVIEVYDSGVEGWQHITADDFVAEPVMPWVPATVATPAQ